MEYVDSPDQVQLSYYSGRIERDASGFHWYDAAGRWEMHGSNVSDVFTVHVPTQDGIDDQAYYRHELLAANGMIEAVEVSGYLHQDYAYGPAGKVYPELPIVRRLQGMWVSWLHTYDDGEWGGGCFWQGRDGLAFGPGYHVKSGVTTAHNDISATPAFNDDGKLVRLDSSIGSDSYTFEFDTTGSYIHYFGRLTESSIGKRRLGAGAGSNTPAACMQRFKLARGR